MLTASSAAQHVRGNCQPGHTFEGLNLIGNDVVRDSSLPMTKYISA